MMEPQVRLRLTHILLLHFSSQEQRHRTMLHSKHILGESWIQAIIDRANSSRKTALSASVPLLDVISEKTCNIVDAVQVCPQRLSSLYCRLVTIVQHVKDNKGEQGLVAEVTASTEAFCNSYRYSTMQASWPLNGVKNLLHALSK